MKVVINNKIKLNRKKNHNMLLCFEIHDLGGAFRGMFAHISLFLCDGKRLLQTVKLYY